MRRILALVAAATLLVACGTDDDGGPVEGPIEVTGENKAVYAVGGWTTERDPLTGREFRCWTAWQGSYHRGGLATFCYELEVAR